MNRPNRALGFLYASLFILSCSAIGASEEISVELDKRYVDPGSGARGFWGNFVVITAREDTVNILSVTTNRGKGDCGDVIDYTESMNESMSKKEKEIFGLFGLSGIGTPDGIRKEFGDKLEINLGAYCTPIQVDVKTKKGSYTFSF